MIDIFPQLYGGLKAKLNAFRNSQAGRTLLGPRQIKTCNAYPYSEQSLPLVTIEEKLNANAEDEMDFVEKRAELLYEINVYDNSKKKMEICRSIAKVVDEYMANDMGFRRINGEPFPNLADNTVYRFLMRYEGYIDTETGCVSRTK